MATNSDCLVTLYVTSKITHTMRLVMIGIALGLLYCNVAEWLVHKHVLHPAGRKKGSWFRFHWVEHHSACAVHDMHDPAYARSVFGNHAQGREALALALGTLAHLPLLPIAPFFTGTVFYGAINYYRTHKRAHLDPAWGKQHLPWHYDHHTAPNQDANWCVTKPFFDHVMDTRQRWIGTVEYTQATQRRAARKADRKAPAREAIAQTEA
jgi:hypothetical protein